RVAAERLGDVFRGHILAVVEGDALADLEAPFLGVVGGFPRFSQNRLRRAVFRRLQDKKLAPGGAEVLWYLRQPFGWVEAVGGFATDQTHAQVAAFLWGLRARCIGEKRICH